MERTRYAQGTMTSDALWRILQNEDRSRDQKPKTVMDKSQIESLAQNPNQLIVFAN